MLQAGERDMAPGEAGFEKPFWQTFFLAFFATVLMFVASLNFSNCAFPLRLHFARIGTSSKSCD